MIGNEAPRSRAARYQRGLKTILYWNGKRRFPFQTNLFLVFHPAAELRGILLIKKSKRPLWTIICLALGILGENERKYLRPDLKEVAVYGA